MNATLSFVLNGKPVTVTSPRDRMLVWVLRDELGLTGTKVGCEAGLCGACTVLVDFEAVPSCVTTVGDVAGKTVLTIEGLAVEGQLDPVQKAFQDHHAFQCGYCTSGMIMAAWAFLKKKPKASRAEIIEAMEGNLCRCGAHGRILDAVESAGKAMGARPSNSPGRAGSPAEPAKEGTAGGSGTTVKVSDAGWQELAPQPEGLSAKGSLAVSEPSGDEPASPLTRLRAIEPFALNAAPGDYLDGLRGGAR